MAVFIVHKLFKYTLKSNWNYDLRIYKIVYVQQV